jgi:HlyD family secretion protein
MLPVSGRLEADESVIAPKVAGRIREITVREGDTVTAGQVLAILDDVQQQARVAQAVAARAVAQDKATSVREQIHVLQQQLIQSQLAVGQAQLDTKGRVNQARAQVIAAAATVEQAAAEVQSARVHIDVLRQQLRQGELAIPQSVHQAEGGIHEAEQRADGADADAARAQAEYTQAQHDADRYTRLEAVEAVTPQQAEQARTQAVSLLAALDSARKAARAAHAALDAAQGERSNPPIRESAVAQLRQQILQAHADLSASIAALRAAQANRGAVHAALTTAESTAANPAVRSAAEVGIADQITQARSDLAAANQVVHQETAALTEARANRADLRVIAPYTGTVTTRTAEPGEVVTAGTPILTMLDMSQVYLRAFVPEGDIGRVKVGQSAHVYLDSAPKAPLKASVLRIDPEASFTPENTYFRDDRVKQVVGIKLHITEAVGYAKPGMPADGIILTSGTWSGDRP